MGEVINKSLKDVLIERMDRQDNKFELATSIIDNAKKGDKSSLNIIDKLLSEKAQSDLENSFPLTDDQFTQVILLYADRVRSATGHPGTNQP